MKLVDFHIHAGDFAKLRDDIQDLLTKIPMEEGVDLRVPFSDADALLRYLPATLEKGIVLAECGPGTNYSIDSRLIADYCKGQDRLIPFGSINPQFHQTLNEFWKSMELGIRGFKFYPADHAFDPLCDEMLEVYALCARFHRPIIFHTGLTAQRDAQQKFINPEDFRLIAEKFPQLVLIFAHAGKPHWHEEAQQLAMEFDHVYLDTALVNPQNWKDAFSNRSKFAHKIVFGSDWPVCGSYSDLLARIQQSGLEEQELRAILYENGNRLINDFLSRQASVEVELQDAVQAQLSMVG